jgi:hypothetical protein
MARVVTYGEIMLRLKSPGHERLFQSPALEATFGGGEANVAVSLANFGIASAFVTAVPANDIGEAAIAKVRRLGVDTRFVRRQVTDTVIAGHPMNRRAIFCTLLISCLIVAQGACATTSGPPVAPTHPVPLTLTRLKRDSFSSQWLHSRSSRPLLTRNSPVRRTSASMPRSGWRPPRKPKPGRTAGRWRSRWSMPQGA